MNRERISVVIPSYNAAGMVEQAVESVLAQSWPDVECIVVDDGSSDSTEDALARYSDRIVYIKKPNGGFASARNLGMERATGEFIAWLDADDIFEPNKLERQMAFFRAAPELGLVCSDFKMFDESGVFLESALCSYYGVLKRGLPFDEIFSQKVALDNGEVCWKGNILASLLLGNFIHPPTVLFRRGVFEKVGPQIAALGNATDYEYLSRVACEFPIGLINEPLLRYRISEGQSSSPKNFAINARFTELALRHIRDNFPISDAQREVVNERIAIMQMTAARYFADDKKLEAFRNLWAAQKGRKPTIQAIIIFVKILTPKFIIRFRRKFLPQEQNYGF